MDKENKQRISLYLDKDLVKAVDRFIEDHYYKSRNDFFTDVAEYYMAMDEAKHNSALKKVFSEACKVFAEENSKALGFCLYRYAVDIDVIMQMIAGITNYTDKEVSEFWHDAKNNIRRTRGRIPPEEIAKGYYINFKSGKNYFDNPPTDDLL